MGHLKDGYPPITLEDPNLRRIIERLRNVLVEAINIHAIDEFDQNGVPTTTQLIAGRTAVWKDADATSTNPTHYLVHNMGGTIITFASEEVVP